MPPKLVVDIELWAMWRKCFQCGNETLLFNGNKDFGGKLLHTWPFFKKKCFKKQIKDLYLSKVFKLSLTCNLPIIITPCAEMFKKLLHGHGLTVYELVCCLFLNRISSSKQVIG